MLPDHKLSKAFLTQLRAYSPITRDQRVDMERVLRSLGRKERIGAKEAQAVADTFRAPLVTVGRAATAGFIEFGWWLTRLQERVPLGLWSQLFSDGPRGVIRPIACSVKQAQAMMRIARNPILSDPAVLDQLPPHWRHLDELTRVPDPVLNQALTRGTIHARMQRSEIAALRPPAPEGAGLARLGRPPAESIDDDEDRRPDPVPVRKRLLNTEELLKSATAADRATLRQVHSEILGMFRLLGQAERERRELVADFLEELAAQIRAGSGTMRL